MDFVKKTKAEIIREDFLWIVSQTVSKSTVDILHKPIRMFAFNQKIIKLKNSSGVSPV